jgi:hypothetical protein
MESQPNEFFFDKTDLFKRIKRLESIIGVNNEFDIVGITTKLDTVEQTLSTINSTYTTKTYVDNSLIAKVNKVGDTLLGNLALLTDPVDNNHVVTKEYVDLIVAGLTDLNVTLLATKEYVDNKTTDVTTVVTAQLDNKISKFGDVLYGELILSDNATQPLHPVTKQQFDTTISTVAQTGNLDW